MSDIVKQYATDEVIIEWRPELCQYSTNCFRSLPAVFNPRIAPWIQPEHAQTSELVSVVRQCPSGALRIQGDPEPVAPTGRQRRVPTRREHGEHADPLSPSTALEPNATSSEAHVGTDAGTNLEARLDTDASKNTKAASNSIAQSNVNTVRNAEDPSHEAVFEIEHGGPVKVHGHVTLKHADGSEEVKATEFELCRCGRSKTKPYCDHSHEEIPGWDDEA